MISFDETVPEGVPVTVSEATRRTRSAKLRRAAIDYYSRDGIIACHCCGMTFEASYGPIYGESCIEIHHKKPIYTYNDNDVNKTIRPRCVRIIVQKL